MNIINYGSENTTNLKILIALSRATQKAHRRSGEIFGSEGLTTAQFAVLEALYHKGSMTISQIIESVLSSGGNMTVVVNNLEKMGLISRCIHPDDRRSSLISITGDGEAKVAAIFPEHLKDLERFFSPLSADEKQTLLLLIRKINP